MRRLFCKNIQILQAVYRHSLSKVNEAKFPENESLWMLLQVWRQFLLHSNPIEICFMSFSPRSSSGSLLTDSTAGHSFSDMTPARQLCCLTGMSEGCEE